jgi:mRNA-degrading endonuclease RelE of RelBE toxin-antitoxin system
LSGSSERVVQQVPRFHKAKRRLPGPVQDAVDEQVRGLLDNPLLGEPKVGILKGVRVVKFKVGPHQYLLAYQFFSKPNVIEVLDVEKYLKSK